MCKMLILTLTVATFEFKMLAWRQVCCLGRGLRITYPFEGQTNENKVIL